jgi:signal transduction histidine kinase
VQINLQLIDVPHLLERCGRTLVPRARSRGVEIAWNAKGVGTLFADELRIRQVLLNLVGNAIKFTPRGGKVEIHAEQVTNGVRLTVTDTGVGMSEEGIRRALEPFVQLDDGLDRQHEGAGLGLPIANRLVELHGGTMIVESRPGNGTRVIVELPSPAPPRPGDLAPPLSKTA